MSVGKGGTKVGSEVGGEGTSSFGHTRVSPSRVRLLGYIIRSHLEKSLENRYSAAESARALQPGRGEHRLSTHCAQGIGHTTQETPVRDSRSQRRLGLGSHEHGRYKGSDYKGKPSREQHRHDHRPRRNVAEGIIRLATSLVIAVSCVPPFARTLRPMFGDEYGLRNGYAHKPVYLLEPCYAVEQSSHHDLSPTSLTLT